MRYVLSSLLLIVLVAGCGDSTSDVIPLGGTDTTAADQIDPYSDVAAPDTACVPQCAAKQCGDDGCGGTCGTCADNEVCTKGVCYLESDECEGIPAVGYCQGHALHTCVDGAESVTDCAADGKLCGFDPQTYAFACLDEACTPVCDDKECGDDGCGALCGLCGDDETCIDGVCEPGACVPQCTDVECGDDGCGGTCGTCTEGYMCVESACILEGCEPDCAGKVCGDDGCGGSCGGCLPSEECVDGACLCTPQTCADLGVSCGETNDGCEGVIDCGGCPDGSDCVDGTCVGCEPQCDGKECGDDGCGGVCGTCADTISCVEGLCICQPLTCDLTGWECGQGDDGCGGVLSCGGCDQGTGPCVDHVCQVCQPQCTGFDCGDDGCGGTCGTCPADYVCIDKICEVDCTPQCTGKVCGSDGCGGVCGECPDGQFCVDGACSPCVLPTSFDQAEKITSLELRASGYTGDGVDVDDKTWTCAPAGDCGDGVDNSFGDLVSLVGGFVDINSQLQDYLDQGQFMIALELEAFSDAGTEFTVNGYQVDVDPAAFCNFQSPGCSYVVLMTSFDGDNCPVISFDNAHVVDGNRLLAGGKGYHFDVPLPLIEGYMMELSLQWAHLDLVLQYNASGDVVGATGAIGGAVPKQILLDMIGELPLDQLGLPLDPSIIIAMIDGALVSDIDLDGDGVKESVSFGFAVETVWGTLDW